MKKQNVRTVSLIVVTFTYLLMGAAVFDHLESTNENRTSILLMSMEKYWRGKYMITDHDYQILETVVLKEVPHKAGQQWEFAGAFYYATTVLTTIGYGHSTPNTIQGKIFTICYAILGIPLCMVLYHSIGERLNKVSSIAIRNIKKLMKMKNTDATEYDLILVVTTLSVITITSGAAVFSSYEGWSYFDSVYYCVITLTTIGFGDMVALQKNKALSEAPDYVAFSLVFILFGMAIIAASLNLFVLRFVTLNTEDERRDEAEALQAAAGAVRLEGDVITANGSILSGEVPHDPMSSTADLASVCSCTCVSCTPCPRGVISRNRYSIRKRPLDSSSRRKHRRSTYQMSPIGVSQSGVRHTHTQEEICSSDSDFGSEQAVHDGSKRSSI